jgi:hypothetical protein
VSIVYEFVDTEDATRPVSSHVHAHMARTAILQMAVIVENLKSIGVETAIATMNRSWGLQLVCPEN